MKRISTAIVSLFLLSSSLNAYAQNIPGTAISKKSFELKVIEKPQTTLTLTELQEYVGNMNYYIGSYPPNFQSEAEREDVYQTWLKLISEAEAHAKKNSGDEDILYLKSELYRQGHNLDVVGSGEKAFETIETCLNIYPKSVSCNFSSSYFFLSIGPTHLDKAEKSLDILTKHFAPELDAEVEAGKVFLAIFSQKNDKAKAQINKFISAFPDEPRTESFKQMLSAFENGKVERVIEN